MLDLQLRQEFRNRRLKGTAIELSNKNETGATQVPAEQFLRITYPTTDVLATLEAVGPNQGRPLTLKGGRGQGKSHLMGLIHHALTDNAATQDWLSNWSKRIGSSGPAELPLRKGMVVISESLHRQRFKFLWDLLFENHPRGDYCRGVWESLGQKKTDIPSDEILLEMFKNQPTALILDEFQTWYDGQTNTKQHPLRTWAFNFIQILSEIAKEHPDLLLLVISVRDGNTDAFQQVQRVNPAIVDFKGPSAKADRLCLLLHRLFENRAQVSEEKIGSLIEVHMAEYLRLKSVPPAEHLRIRGDFVQAWPYAPHLMELLEDQVLMATHAQETRDLIRILADLFKRRGEQSPIITASDFRLEDESSGITALLDSVTNQHHKKLKEKALRNLEAARAAVENTTIVLPHLEGVIGALWLRSIADSNLSGAAKETLQADVTGAKAVDDNAFNVELATIVENSFNIHEDGNRLVFREQENPQAKLIANARNDKLFPDGRDRIHLAKEIRYVIGGGSDTVQQFQVIVLPREWQSAPWEKLEEAAQPRSWGEKIPVLVLPQSPSKPEPALGHWLKEHLSTNRNTVRFLLPREGTQNVFTDRNLIILSRAVVLADNWRSQNPEYSRLLTRYQKELREGLKSRFDRFAILLKWDFQKPESCTFIIEIIERRGAKYRERLTARSARTFSYPKNLIVSFILLLPVMNR